MQAQAAERCPSCGSTKLVYKPFEGTIVCYQCGYVVEDVVFDSEAGMHGDDYADIATPRRGRPLRLRHPVDPRTLRAAARRVLRSGGVYDFSIQRRVSLLDLEAEKILATNPVAEVARLLSEVGLTTGKTARVKLALSLYVLCLARGGTRSGCIREASVASGASVSRLEAIASEYRGRVSEVVSRVRREWLTTGSG